MLQRGSFEAQTPRIVCTFVRAPAPAGAAAAVKMTVVDPGPRGESYNFATPENGLA
jgi:hypothetical protein